MSPLPSLAGLFLSTDLCIGAFGATTWERLCLSIPTIGVATSNNQEIIASSLPSGKNLHVLDKPSSITTDSFSSILETCFNPQSIFSYKYSHEIDIDGYGASRIAYCLESLFSNSESLSLSETKSRSSNDSLKLIQYTLQDKNIPILKITILEESSYHFNITSIVEIISGLSKIKQLSAYKLLTKISSKLTKDSRVPFLAISKSALKSLTPFISKPINTEPTLLPELTSITLLSDPDSWIINYYDELLPDFGAWAHMYALYLKPRKLK